ncbi:MAG: DPP IV N-terminal domain-containing protein [Muribaculaceae bacterium]|nr:DPP IV N-terminal domain-containing protein [Muribaculaceae bacterium]
MKQQNLRIIIAAVVAIVACSLGANAQKQFTLEDLNFGGKNYRNMIAKSRTLTWWGDQLLHLEKDSCWTVDKKNGKEKLAFTAQQVKQWCGLGNDAALSLAWVSFPYGNQPLMLVYTADKRMLVDVKKHKLEWSQSTKGETEQDWCKASRNVAFVKNDNLWITTASGETKQITTDGSREIVYAQSVHRNEFGIEKGTFWSNKGTRLAFYRMDQSMVADYPLITVPEIYDSVNVEATPAPEKYPMAGRTSHKVQVGILDVATGKVVYLNTGDPTDRYFTNIAWSPDDALVYMFELNRDQNDCRLVSYNAVTGDKVAEIYRETSDKYVEPQHPITFLPWDNGKFVMQSQKDGYNHLYLYNADGTLVKQLTSGNWVVMEMLGFDTEHKAVLISSNEISPIQCNLFSVDVATGKRSRIDEGGKGWHGAVINENGTWVADYYSEPTVPRNIAVLPTTGQGCLRYFTAPNPWEGYNVPEYSCGTIKADDGVTDLYYRMVKPVDFDPAKKYPTVVYVYGGPHAHNVDARWNYCSRSWETYMAQKGYLLFILDNRGSENRGRDFEQATFRQLGQVEMRDQMRGVEFLRTLPYVDMDRLGVHGWSFGGFMTISLMTNYPDVFKVGVAGGPVIDWKWYEVMYGERYMDTPQSNPEGYAKTSLIHKAKDLKGRLQIIIGLNDPTVVPQHAYSFLKACIAAGTQPDFYVYPGQGHNMRGHQSVHLHERITRYFEDYLKP